MFNAFVRRYMIAFIYIVSSVFQLEFPRTPRVAPLPWSGVLVSRFFPPAGFFRGFRVRLWCIAFLLYLFQCLMNCTAAWLSNAPMYPSLSVRLKDASKRKKAMILNCFENPFKQAISIFFLLHTHFKGVVSRNLVKFNDWEYQAKRKNNYQRRSSL